MHLASLSDCDLMGIPMYTTHQQYTWCPLLATSTLLLQLLLSPLLLCLLQPLLARLLILVTRWSYCALGGGSGLSSPA